MRNVIVHLCILAILTTSSVAPVSNGSIIGCPPYLQWLCGHKSIRAN